MDNRTNISDDEIDLLELASVIWKRRYIIAAFVVVVSILTVIAVLLMDNVYESKAVLKSSDQSSSQSNLGGLGTLAGFAGINLSAGGSVYGDIQVLLNDKSFISEFVKKNELAPLLLEDKTILEDESFKKNENFKFYQLIKGSIASSEDKITKYISIRYTHTQPETAQKILSLLLVDISDKLRVKQMENLDKRIENYKLEIDRANDITLKNKLSEMVANLVQSKVFANADEYYGFSIISEPSLSEPMDKVGPKRSAICVIAFITSCIIGVVIAIIYEYIKNIRTEGRTQKAKD